jgi:hypothetical protein
MPLPSWRTGTTAQAAHGCTSTTRPPGRGPLFVTPPEKQPDACRSRCRTSRRAQCSRRLFFCRGHAAVPVFIAPWLVVDVRFDVLFETRGDGREPRGVGRFFGVLGGVSRPEFGDWCSVVRQGLGGAWRSDLADCPPVMVARPEGSRRCQRCPTCSFASHSGCASTPSINS